MRRLILLLTAFVLFCSHDMFLKLERTYFLAPHTPVTLQLFNGTFYDSDNIITRDRMLDISLVGGGQHLHPDTTQWTDQGDTTLLRFETGMEGTWVAGVSTRARTIEMTAADFNDYLAHDGVLDLLDQRRQSGQLEAAATEKYSKHVKAIFQVGGQRSLDWQTRLGYPIEFVPLANPYHLHEGEDLKVQLLWQGEPLPNQLVYAGSVATAHSHEHTHTDGTTHSHSHDEGDTDHEHHDATQLRTDSNGVVTLPAPADGIWYLRTIHLVETDAPGLTHESNWATLTFELGQRHSHETAGHTHAEEAPVGGIPSYVYWVGSLLLIVGLFFWFNRKSNS